MPIHAYTRIVVWIGWLPADGDLEVNTGSRFTANIALKDVHTFVTSQFAFRLKETSSRSSERGWIDPEVVRPLNGT